MNHPARRFFVFILGVLLSAAVAPAAPATKASTQAARTKERIDALVNRRLNPAPLPADLPNPFLLGVGVRKPGGSDVGSPDGSEVAAHPTKPPEGELPPPSSDAEALALYAAKLKIGGTLQINGQFQLLVNESAYKEGDLIFLDKKDAVIYLQIVHLSPTELTLGFKDAVLTVRLKGG